MIPGRNGGSALRCFPDVASLQTLGSAALAGWGGAALGLGVSLIVLSMLWADDLSLHRTALNRNKRTLAAKRTLPILGNDDLREPGRYVWALVVRQACKLAHVRRGCPAAGQTNTHATMIGGGA